MLSVTFDVDHKVLLPGVYLAKLDRMGEVAAVTLDIRLRRPYLDPVLSERQMHTFEHVYATAARNTPANEDTSVLYFGPMGCNTGFYLLYGVRFSSEEDLERKVLSLPEHMQRAAEYVATMQKVPANNEYQCGNCYTLGDVSLAQELALALSALLDGVKERGYTEYVRMDQALLRRLEEE